MALSITHATTATGADDPTKQINKGEWNAAHALTGVASAAQGGTGIAFFTAAGPTAERIYTFPDSAATMLFSGGALGTPSSGVATNLTGLLLNNVAAATGAATIASGDNAQVWQWSLSTANKVAFRWSESAASTATGTPVLVQIDTLAASTAIPLRVQARGTEAIFVSAIGRVGIGTSSPTETLHIVGNLLVRGAATHINILQAGGIPTAFLGDVTGAGEGGLVLHDNAGAQAAYIRAGVGEASFIKNSNFGIGTTSPTALFDVSGATASSVFARGSTDATAFAINARKSRGTVAAPTVIATGDDLLTINGYGYVGATNTYQEAARIAFDSTGTITDSATGIGGIMRFLTAVQGAEPVEAMSVQAAGDVTLGLPSPATTAAVGFPQMPTMAGTPTGVPTAITGFTPFVYDTTGDKIWVYDYGAAAWKGAAVV